MIRTALYIRVSTEDQAVHGISLEAQDAVLTDYAKKNDLTIVDRYIDEGITARKAIAKRKELMRLLDDVKAGKIDQIIFTKLDRWTRNIRDFYKVQDVLDAHKVTWKTVLESYGTTDATSRLHLNIMLSISQDEADRTSERIKVVFENKIKNKEYTTNKIPFGYRVEKSKVYKDEEKQDMVEDMFRKFFECNSIRATQIYMRDTYGIEFDVKNFRNIFKNTLYCGEYRGVTEFCEPYLTRAQFDEIRAIMKEKNVKRTPTGLTYIFTGLLACGECGKPLGSCYNKRGPGGLQKVAAYRCSKHVKDGSCDFRPVLREAVIEEYLWKNAVAELDKYKAQFDIHAEEKKKQKKTGTAEKAAERIKKKLNKLKDLYVNDLISIDDYKKDYEELNQQLADLTAESTKDETPIDVEAIKKLLSGTTEEIYQSLTAEDRRQFWRGFIDKIIVHAQDNMEIIWK